MALCKHCVFYLLQPVKFIFFFGKRHRDLTMTIFSTIVYRSNFLILSSENVKNHYLYVMLSGQSYED